MYRKLMAVLGEESKCYIFEICKIFGIIRGDKESCFGC